jgi:hypothetical protein
MFLLNFAPLLWIVKPVFFNFHCDFWMLAFSCCYALLHTVPYRLNMELDLQSLFGLLQLFSLAETPQLPPPPHPSPHLGSYTRVLLVSQDRRHFFVTPCCILLLRNLYGNSMPWQLHALWTRRLLLSCCTVVESFLISTLKNSNYSLSHYHLNQMSV